MIRISAFAFALACVAPHLGNGQPIENRTLADRLAAIQKDHDDAEAALRKFARALPETQESVKKYEERRQALNQQQAERFLAAVKLAKLAPRSDAGFAALDWVLNNAFGEPAGKAALALLSENHADNPQVAKMVALAALKKEYADASVAFNKSLAALPETDEGLKKAEELQKSYAISQAKRLHAAVSLARADPNSPVGFSALDWVLTDGNAWHDETGQLAIQLLTEHHAANPKVGKVVAYLGLHGQGAEETVDAKKQALFDVVIQKNKDRTARGQAALAKAWKVRQTFSLAEHNKQADADRLAAIAERAFEDLLKEYSDTACLIGDAPRTLGSIARQELFELRHLRVGKTAPDLAAVDLDGKKLQLRDFRGKVTVIVFWATWCPSCMASIPHERKLADRHKDRPFAIVGVNGDSDRAEAKEAGAKAVRNWPSFWNGPDAGFGSISETWNVHAWPAIYVLDQQGIIRYRNVHGSSLDQAVDQLLGK